MLDEERVDDAVEHLFEAINGLYQADDDRVHDIADDLVELHDELALLYNGSGEYREEDPYDAVEEIPY